jgi:integrase
MRGSTRKRGATWTCYWDIGTDPMTGRRKQTSKGGFRTQKDAQRHLASVVVRVGDGTYIEPSKQPLASFMLDEWLPAISATVRPNTQDTYLRLTRRHIAQRDIGAMPLRALTGAHLNALYADLERCADPACDHAKQCQGLSVNSRRLLHSILHRALRDAMRWDKLGRNPADSADPPAFPHTQVQAWTVGELRRFLERVRDDRLSALWRLAATTGMRRGELLGLSLLALDLDGARLRVDRQLKADCSFGPPKSRRSERTIALDAETVDALRHHVQTQMLERELARSAYEDADLVFCDELGRRIRPGHLSEVFVRHRKAAGVSVGSLHVLRHTAATIALTADPPVPLHVVAGRLGDDPKTVLSTYAHLLPHSDALAAETIASALFVDKPLTPSVPLDPTPAG